MENKKFDELIKRVLENLDGEKYVPQDWSAMEENLDADGNGFDQFVVQSIGNLDGEKIVPMDWSAMENKLDASIEANSTADSESHPELEDIYLDAVAYEHLNSIEPPYKKEHWEIMSARLDEEYAYRRRVIFTKSLEAAIVLLLVWTAINFFPNKKPNPINSVAKDQFAITPSNHDNTNDLNLPNQLLPNNQDQASVDNSSENASKQVPNVKNIGEEFSSNDDDVIYASDFGRSISSGNLLFSVEKISQRKNLVAPFLEKKNEPLALETNSNGELILEKPSTVLEEKLHIHISPIPSLASSLLPTKQLDNPNFGYSELFKKKRIRTHEVFFSMFAAANYDYVESDFYNVKIREQDIYQRGRYGYSGGFAIGFQLNRLLVETGASYDLISYQQRDETKIFGNITEGYIEEQWKDAELNMLQIPLNIQYSFLVKKKWKMYSLTGVSLNMALQNNFNYQLELEGNTTATRSPISEQSSIASQASNYRGIFEGGSFKENSYLTANIGFGLERKLTYRWSLYLQPIYQQYFLFEGIGPNQDRIHSGSVRFGAKVKLR